MSDPTAQLCGGRAREELMRDGTQKMAIDEKPLKTKPFQPRLLTGLRVRAQPGPATHDSIDSWAIHVAALQRAVAHVLENPHVRPLQLIACAGCRCGRLGGWVLNGTGGLSANNLPGGASPPQLQAPAQSCGDSAPFVSTSVLGDGSRSPFVLGVTVGDWLSRMRSSGSAVGAPATLPWPARCRS